MITLLINAILLYVWYRAGMFYLKHKHDLRWRLGPLFYVLEAALLVGLLGDVLFNWTLGIALFLDLPKEPTVTERLRRYQRDPKYAGTWRARLARAVCRELNKYDPDGHC